VPGYADGGITGGGEATQGVTPSLVTNVQKQLLAGVDSRKLPPLGVMLALQDEKFVKQLQLTAGAKNQQALDEGRQAAQAPTVYDDELNKLASAGVAGMDAGVMDEPMMAASGGIIAFNGGGDTGRPIRYAVPGQEYADLTKNPLYRAEMLQRQREADRNKLQGRSELRPEDFTPSIAATAQGYGLGAVAPTAMQQPPAQPAPVTQAAPVAQQAPAARPAPTAAPAIKPEEPRPSLLYTGKKPEEAFAEKEAEMEKRFPSELKDRLEDLKAQGQQAVKDRDADRWLAVAMGGFAAAAGQSPYALQNFAQGLGITTKEMRDINKDFRKAEDLRKQIEREERKANRLEGMQKYDAADKARTRVEDITRDAQKADAMYKAKLEELSIKRTAVDVEREKVGATREGNAAYRENMLQSRNITAFNSAVQKEKELLTKSIPMMSAPPEQLEQRAIRNVITRNPQFAELAGVPVNAAAATPSATMRYNPKTGKVEPVQ